MTQACVDFAVKEEAEQLTETIPPASRYVLECTYDIFDPKAVDQYSMGPQFHGKTVEGGSWKVYSDNLDYLMTYAETLALNWAADRLCNAEAPYAIGRWEIRRLGLPLLALESQRNWVAVGDDYLDPWPEESIGETQLANLPIPDLMSAFSAAVGPGALSGGDSWRYERHAESCTDPERCRCMEPVRRPPEWDL